MTRRHLYGLAAALTLIGCNEQRPITSPTNLPHQASRAVIATPTVE